MNDRYQFRFTFFNEVESKTVTHQRECTFEEARTYWQELLDISRMTRSSAHKAWYRGQFGQRWHRWK